MHGRHLSSGHETRQQWIRNIRFVSFESTWQIRKIVWNADLFVFVIRQKQGWNPPTSLHNLNQQLNLHGFHGSMEGI